MKISKDLYMRISSITGVDYSGIIMNENEFVIENVELVKMIQDLICEIDRLEEELE